MTCPNCRGEMIDGAKFCKKCGTKLEQDRTPEIWEKEEYEKVLNYEAKTSSVQAVDYSKSQIELPQKRSKKGLIIGLIAGGIALIIALVCIVLYLFFLTGESARESEFEDQYYVQKDQGNVDFDYSGMPNNNNTSIGKKKPLDSKEVAEKIEKEHSYSIVKSDVSWEDAEYYASTRGKNTYLATINNVEEFEKVTNMAYNAGIRVLWLGDYRRRGFEWNETDWLDGSSFNGLNLWYEGEPSMKDENGNEEFYLMAFCVNGKWYLNDAVSDVSKVYPGKIGYIVEEE